MKGMFYLPHFSTVMSNGHLKPKLSKTYFWILALLFSISENDNPTFPPHTPFSPCIYFLHFLSYSYIQSISKSSWLYLQNVSGAQSPLTMSTSVPWSCTV